MRYLAAQFSALLEDELWLRNASKIQCHGPAPRGQRSAVFLGCGWTSRSSRTGSSRPWIPALIEPLQREWNFHVWDDR